MEIYSIHKQINKNNSDASIKGCYLSFFRLFLLFRAFFHFSQRQKCFLRKIVGKSLLCHRAFIEVRFDVAVSL